MLVLGLILIAGGASALLRETLWQVGLRVEWVVASAVLLLVGLLSLAVATDKIHLPDAYFSMTPERIRYRLSLLGRERQLHWTDISTLQVSERLVVFQQRSGEEIKMRLGLIQQPEIALHVARSIMLAALERGIPVNAAKAMPREPSQ